MKMFLKLACFITLLFTNPIQTLCDRLIQKGDNDINFRGQSGQIAISNIYGEEASIKWKKIEEYDYENKKVDFVNNFASQTYTWSLPVQTQYNEENCTLVNFNSILHSNIYPQNNIYMNITTYIFTRDVEVSYGNTTIMVPKNTVKFTLSMSNWIFKNFTNMLRIGTEIRSSEKSGRTKSINDYRKLKITKDEKVEDYSKPKYNERTLIVDNSGFYDMPSFAIIDGIQTPIDVSLYSEDNKISIMWEFPKFNNMIYDPVIGTRNSLTSFSVKIHPDYFIMFLMLTLSFIFLN